jgi:HK97 family phage portal protein
MGLRNALIKWFNLENDKNAAEIACLSHLSMEINYKKLAVEACVNLIAGVLAGCEFQTYKEGKETRGDMYYLFNLRPNANQSAGVFWRRFLSRLLKANEVVVIRRDDELYVADSYHINEKGLKPNRYENVRIGDVVLNGICGEKDVLHVCLHDENIREVIDGIYNSYGKLIDSAQKTFKRKNAFRVVLEEPGVGAMDEDTRTKRKDLFEKSFMSWFEADNAGAVLPIPSPLKLHDWSKNDRAGQAHTSRDIRALIDDIFDFTAISYRVPQRLIRGDIAELSNNIDAFIMFCINPLAETIQDEINAKMYGKNAYLKRTYMKIDTSLIKMADIIRYAAAADKLYAASIHSVNENRKMLGKEPIDEAWADEHVMTKNYNNINDVKRL